MSVENVQTGVAKVDRGLEIHLPDGAYVLAFDDWETAWMRGWSPKVYVWFRVDRGEFAGAFLRRCYNVSKLTGRGGPRGGFVVGPKSDYYREFVACIGIPGPSDIVTPDAYASRIVIGDVVTVERGRDGEPLIERYSTIRKLRPQMD